MEKIQANKVKSWFQTTHNKCIYQWRTSKQGKTNVARAKKVKYKVKHLDTI